MLAQGFPLDPLEKVVEVVAADLAQCEAHSRAAVTVVFESLITLFCRLSRIRVSIRLKYLHARVRLACLRSRFRLEYPIQFSHHIPISVRGETNTYVGVTAYAASTDRAAGIYGPSGPVAGSLRGSFRFIDLFAGSADAAGLEAVGGRCVFTSEWTPRPRRPTGPTSAMSKSPVTSGMSGPVKFLITTSCSRLPLSAVRIAGVSKKNSLGRSHGFATKPRERCSSMSRGSSMRSDLRRSCWRTSRTCEPRQEPYIRSHPAGS